MSEALASPIAAGRRAATGARPLVAAACIAVIAVMLFPIAMTFLSSIKTAAEASASPPHYLPTSLSLENYLKVYHYQAGLPVYLGNSLAVALLTIGLCLLLAVPAGYGLARFPIPARETLFLVLISGLMIPYQALLTPLYQMFASLGLANTHLGLAIVHTVLQLPFSIYLMRNAFEEVPRELEEAAIVDGCNSLAALWHVFLPVARPAIVTVVLFAFITSWNEFLGALVLMNRGVTFTLPLVLANARQETSIGGTDWGMLQAGITVSIIPCVLFYLLLQKYYVSGFLSGAVK